MPDGTTKTTPPETHSAETQDTPEAFEACLCTGSEAQSDTCLKCISEAAKHGRRQSQARVRQSLSEPDFKIDEIGFSVRSSVISEEGLYGYGSKKEKNENKWTKSDDNWTNNEKNNDNHWKNEDNIKENVISDVADMKSSIRKQLLIALLIGSCNFILGSAEGYSAILPKLQDDKDSGLEVDHDVVKWLISSMFLTALIGNMIGTTLGDMLGNKRLLSLIAPITVLLWGVHAYPTTLWVLFAVRLSMGLLYGIVNTLVNPLVSEMVHPSVRGVANVFPEVLACIGTLLSFLQAHLFGWRLATLLLAVPVIPAVICLPFIPESPYWLVKNNQLDLAEKSLLTLYGGNRELKVKQMMKELVTNLSTNEKSSVKEQVKLMRLSKNWKPLATLCTIFVFRELCGKSCVFFYSVFLFREAGVALDPFLCTLMVGVARMISTLLCTLVLDKYGRRSVLMMSCGVCIGCLIAVGAVLMVGVSSMTSWIPLVGVLTFTLFYSIGISPIPWSLMGELLPLSVRSLSTSIVCVVFSCFIFMATNVTPTLMLTIGVGGSFLMFAGFSFLLLVVVAVFLPETKGLSLLELEYLFDKRGNAANIKHQSKA